jgi:hypothetical protein
MGAPSYSKENQDSIARTVPVSEERTVPGARIYIMHTILCYHKTKPIDAFPSNNTMPS